MTKLDRLTQAASTLRDEQLDGLLGYVESLSAAPFYYSAPPEALASIERGLAQVANGETMPGEEVFARLQAKIDATRA